MTRSFIARNPSVLIFLLCLAAFTLLVTVLAEGFGIGIVSTSFVKVLGKTLCLCLVAIAMDLIWGCAGVLSLGHMAFFALGGYLIGMWLMYARTEEIVIAALKSGKATFAEKPLAISIEGCDHILAAAMRTGTRLYVGHNMRHYAMVLKMKALIDEGAIGAVKAVWCRHFVGHGGDFYFKDWHAQRQHVNSLLLQKGAHDLDVIHWLAGGVSRVVQGFGRLAVYGEVTDRQLDAHPLWSEPGALLFRSSSSRRSITPTMR